MLAAYTENGKIEPNQYIILLYPYVPSNNAEQRQNFKDRSALISRTFQKIETDFSVYLFAPGTELERYRYRTRCSYKNGHCVKYFRCSFVNI